MLTEGCLRLQINPVLMFFCSVLCGGFVGRHCSGQLPPIVTNYCGFVFKLIVDLGSNNLFEMFFYIRFVFVNFIFYFFK